MTAQICINVANIPYFIQVTQENKDEVIKFLTPWDVADIQFGTNCEGAGTYTLIHKDPDYNASADDEAPYLWGYVGEYLLKEREYPDVPWEQDVPEQVSEKNFKRFYRLPGDDGNFSIQVDPYEVACHIEEAYNEQF